MTTATTATTATTTSTPHFALPAELTIFTATETRDALLAALAGATDADAPLVVDAAAVIDVDGAGVQLLVALSRLCERDERSWRLQAPGDALVAACHTLGLSAWLDRHAVDEAAAAILEDTR
ncbi:STAS domain-containing protein [Sphaerotilus mobilis]|uniref:Anti-anti-sigma regulatory factor n=1 Tax=Sphaerotilus mobilis TaxID=47994 RepID=A0A4Q7LGV4_9BURK|nr:STAS domain-containing protein [Sphaerotilus mobilis]RZS52937.1 anti-anti-sigma regulatory factor [Sphaerotilus mobilis]